MFIGIFICSIILLASRGWWSTELTYSKRFDCRWLIVAEHRDRQYGEHRDRQYGELRDNQYGERRDNKHDEHRDKQYGEHSWQTI